MADISFNPKSVSGGSWRVIQEDGSGGYYWITVTSNRPKLTINSVSLNVSTRKLTINYSLAITRDSGNVGWNVGAIACWIDDTTFNNPIKFLHNGDDHSTYDSTWYQNGALSKTYVTEDTTIDWNGSGTQNVPIKVRSLQGWGYSPDRWQNDDYCSTGSTTMVISGLVENPTITSVSCYENSPGYVTYTAQATPGTGSISNYQWTINNSPYSGTSGTIGPFPENTDIIWSLTVNASDGGKAETSGSFYTEHTTVPVIVNEYVDIQARSNDHYPTEINYQVQYTGAVSSGSRYLMYGTTPSYGTYASLVSDANNNIVWSLGNLNPHTTYYYFIIETDDGRPPLSAETSQQQFTTPGLRPVINNVSATPSYTSCSFDVNYSLDNTNLHSTQGIGIRIGTYSTVTQTIIYNEPIYFSSSPCVINNLTSGQRYYYQIEVKDDQGNISNIYPSSGTTFFTTLIRAPWDVSLEVLNYTTSTITIRTHYHRDSGPQVGVVVTCSNGDTQWGGPHYTGYDYMDVTFAGLTPDTNYSFEGYAYTQGTGGGASSIATTSGSTLLTEPVATLDDITDPFSIQVVAVASVVPSGRTLQYRFKKDNGNWTSYGSSAIHTWNDLVPETTYQIQVQVKAIHQSTYAVDTTTTVSKTITTPADQASVAIKNTTWQTGKVWFKNGNAWEKAKKVYIKKNGSWVENKNFN